jgi:hypothetical protein
MQDAININKLAFIAQKLLAEVVEVTEETDDK